MSIQDTIKKHLIDSLGEERVSKMTEDEMLRIGLKMMKDSMKKDYGIPLPSNEAKPSQETMLTMEALLKIMQQFSGTSNPYKAYQEEKIKKMATHYGMSENDFKKFQDNPYPSDCETKATPENTPWTTHQGKTIMICEMTTLHLFNGILLLVRKDLRKFFKNGLTVRDYLEIMLKEIAKEKRDKDLSDIMLEQLAEATRAIKSRNN